MITVYRGECLDVPDESPSPEEHAMMVEELEQGAKKLRAYAANSEADLTPKEREILAKLRKVVPHAR